MKRLMICGLVVLSLFGLMIVARNGGGGGGRGGSGGGRGGSSFGGGRSGGRSMGSRSSMGASRVSGRTSVLGTSRLGGTNLSSSTRVPSTTRVSGTTRVGRSSARFSGRRDNRWHGHGYGHRGFRRHWSGPIFWDTGLYPYFYDYCDANPWDERCYGDYYYDDYVEPGIGFSIGF